MKPSEVLEKAIEGLETHGWIQHSEVEPDLGMCALGSMKYGVELIKLHDDGRLYLRGCANSCCLTGDRRKAFFGAADFLAKATGTVAWDLIASWNDYPTRTKDDVLTAFRHALKFAKEEEDAAA